VLTVEIPAEEADLVAALERDFGPVAGIRTVHPEGRA
jgi:hypothetical protein